MTLSWKLWPCPAAPARRLQLPKGLWASCIDAALQYYIMPVGIGGVFYRVSSTLPGFRAGAGVLLSLGPGDLGLGMGWLPFSMKRGR